MGTEENTSQDTVDEFDCSSALEKLPNACIQYGVMLVNADGSESGHSLRWRECWDATDFGQKEVAAKRAVTFRVFREASI